MTSTQGNAKRVDRRVLRTRKAIMDAFDKLICEGDFSKISVSSIAREADIDRKTFYLHYKSINDLIEYKTAHLIDQLLDVLKSEGPNKSHLERLHLVLERTNEILTTNLTFYTNIALHLSTDQTITRLLQAAEPTLTRTRLATTPCGNPQLALQTQFCIAGAIYLYSSWLRSDHNEPIETVSEAIEYTIGVMYQQAMQEKHRQ